MFWKNCDVKEKHGSYVSVQHDTGKKSDAFRETCYPLQSTNFAISKFSETPRVKISVFLKESFAKERNHENTRFYATTNYTSINCIP